MAVTRFKPDQSTLIVVDLQEKLIGHMHDENALLIQSAKLIRGAAALEIPTIATEQYPKGLGSTVQPIADALAESPHTTTHPKTTFSAFTDPVRDFLQQHARPSVVLCGIEAHVCVLQTALDLMAAGYLVGLVTDAVSSRRPSDQQTALARLTGAGVIPLTVEMILFEWAGRADSPAFKAILPIVK